MGMEWSSKLELKLEKFRAFISNSLRVYLRECKFVCVCLHVCLFACLSAPASSHKQSALLLRRPLALFRLPAACPFACSLESINSKFALGLAAHKRWRLALCPALCAEALLCAPGELARLPPLFSSACPLASSIFQIQTRGRSPTLEADSIGAGAGGGGRVPLAVALRRCWRPWAVDLVVRGVISSQQHRNTSCSLGA